MGSANLLRARASQPPCELGLGRRHWEWGGAERGGLQQPGPGREAARPPAVSPPLRIQQGSKASLPHALLLPSAAAFCGRSRLRRCHSCCRPLPRTAAGAEARRWRSHTPACESPPASPTAAAHPGRSRARAAAAAAQAGRGLPSSEWRRGKAQRQLPPAAQRRQRTRVAAELPWRQWLECRTC